MIFFIWWLFYVVTSLLWQPKSEYHVSTYENAEFAVKDINAKIAELPPAPLYQRILILVWFQLYIWRWKQDVDLTNFWKGAMMEL